MGVRNFSKTFKKFKVVPIKDYAGKRIAVDAMTEIYRAALGMKNPHTLTDKSGNPTGHISVIILNIVKLRKLGIEQIWVFDSSESDPAKAMEDARRAGIKEKASEKLKKMVDEVFSEDDEEDQEKQKRKEAKKSETRKLEKQVFHITSQILADVFMILNGFGIPYIISPPEIQAECVCAALTRIPELPKEVQAKYENLRCDAVLSPDTDSLLFGAVRVLKRIKGQPNDLEKYKLSAILKTYDITQKELIKIGIVLGCDFYIDTEKLFHGIGPAKVFNYVKNDEKGKTNLKKPGPKIAYKRFQYGYKNYQKIIDDAKRVFPETDPKKSEAMKTELLRWLVQDKSFKESLWKPRIFVAEPKK